MEHEMLDDCEPFHLSDLLYERYIKVMSMKFDM